MRKYKSVTFFTGWSSRSSRIHTLLKILMNLLLTPFPRPCSRFIFSCRKFLRETERSSMLPCKKCGRILMEILLHVISRHNSTWWQFGPNWHQIPWLFHVIYPGYICFPCSNIIWALDKFSSWNFHGIYQENDGISRADLVSFPTTLLSKRHEKSLSHFLQGTGQ